MKILITGICGFVGSTLARALREAHPGSEMNRAPRPFDIQ